MALYTDIPAIVNDLITRLKAEATTDARTNVVLALVDIGTVTWYNLPFNLNKLVQALSLYQAYLVDNQLQDLLKQISTVYWYDLFTKVALIIRATERIESLT